MISHILYDINIIYIDKMIFIWYFVLGTIIMEGHMIKSFKKGFNPAERAGKGSGISAFTLAEVLITLGIIGVVAAMTMPTLMNSTQGAQYKTAYKKALSVLSQAVVLNIALDDYDLSQTTSATTNDDDPSLFNLFTHRMNVVKTQGNTYTARATTSTGTSDSGVIFGGENYTLYFNDGITFTFATDSSQCTIGDETIDTDDDTKGTDTTPGKCYGVIDVNGEKNPNRIVNCDKKAWNAEFKDGDTCVVTNPTDIYPVVMYDQSVLPSTEAGRAVLYGDN